MQKQCEILKLFCILYKSYRFRYCLFIGNTALHVAVMLGRKGMSEILYNTTLPDCKHAIPFNMVN